MKRYVACSANSDFTSKIDTIMAYYNEGYSAYSDRRNFVVIDMEGQIIVLDKAALSQLDMDFFDEAPADAIEECKPLYLDSYNMNGDGIARLLTRIYRSVI